MAKRFIDTELRRKELRGVDPKHRLSYEWLWQNCDAAGVWEVDMDLFRFELGFKLNVEGLVKSCPWVKVLPSGSVFLTDFARVNYGTLKAGYNPHKPVFRSLEKNGIDPVTLQFQDLGNPSARVEEEGEEEDNSEKKEHAHEPTSITTVSDLPFTSDAFVEAWSEWETSRREAGKTIKPTGRRLQLAKCREWGEARAIAALRHSATNSYTGLYEPTNRSSNGTASKTQPERDEEFRRIIAERYAGQ